MKDIIITASLCVAAIIFLGFVLKLVLIAICVGMSVRYREHLDKLDKNK